MSEEFKDGGPAFAAGAANEMGCWTQEGMSLRDWFAGTIMAGMAANSSWDAEGWDASAKRAYSAADAMLNARGEA